MTLAHRIDGPESAPPLVLSSSLGTSWELWDAQVPALTGQLRVLRYDHPGHGRSDLPDGPVTVTELARELLALLDRLELARVSFCGLSLGGLVGMELALDAPERLDRLVLACTSARFGPPEAWDERAAIVRARGTAAIADAVLARWFTERFREQEPETVARFRSMFESTTREGYVACCAAVRDWDARDRLEAVEAPTLVIVGADDPASTRADGAFLAERIPDARLLVLPDAAHLANVAQPDHFAAALLEHVTAASEVWG